MGSKLFLIILFLFGSTAAGFACYSGLTVIPTAETVEADQYCIYLQLDGALPIKKVDTRIINTEFGIGERFEAGLDYDFSEESDSRLLLNAKYLLTQDSDKSPATAVGVCNVGRKLKSSPYLAATHDFSVIRAHLGAMRIEEKNRWFAGLDKSINDNIMLMADYTNGRENYSSLGFNYQFTDNFGITTGVLFPNNTTDEKYYTIYISLSGLYRKPTQE